MQAEGTIRKLTPEVAVMTDQVAKLRTELENLPTKRLDIDRAIRVSAGAVGKAAGEEYGAAFKAAYVSAMADFATYQAAAGSRVGTMATEQVAGTLTPMSAVIQQIPITPINAAGDAVLTLRDKFDLLQASILRSGDAVREVMEIEMARADKLFATLGSDLTVSLAHGAAAALAGRDGKEVIAQAMSGIFTTMGGSLIAAGATMLKLLPALSNPFTSGPAMIVAGVALSTLGVALGSAGSGVLRMA